MKQCFYCKSESKELRPYGPDRAYICFDCMTADPKREAAAAAELIAQMAACGPVCLIGDDGPIPISLPMKGPAS